MLPVLLFVLQSAGTQQPVFDGHLRQLDVRVPRIEATGTARVEILDAGVGIFELGLFEQTFQAPGIAPDSGGDMRGSTL